MSDLADELLAIAEGCDRDDVASGGAAIVPSGLAAGRRLAELAENDAGGDWLLWAIMRPADRWPADFRRALDEFVTAWAGQKLAELASPRRRLAESDDESCPPRRSI